jgi:hypothetical protein
MAVAQQRRTRAGERGGSRLNFLIVATIIALAAYSAYNYAPVAYQAFLFRDYMQETVNKAAYPPGQANEWIAQQLRASAKQYDVPEDALINVQKEEGQIVVRVQWTRPVKLPGYTYQYKFDHTARSSGFINPQ